MTRYILIVVIVVIASESIAGEDTYLLFDVDVSGYGLRDPIFLAVERDPKNVHHLRIERHLLLMPPGAYRLDHIDFHEKSFSGSFHGWAGSGMRPRSLHLYPDEDVKIGINFFLQEGYINYLGTMSVSKNSKGRLELKFVSQKSLVRKACAISPELLTEKTLKLIFHEGINKEYKIDCASLTS